MTEHDNKDTPPRNGGKAPQKKKGFHRSPTSVAGSLNSDAAVPMLRLGNTNNFDTFKKKLSIACMEKYKNLGCLIHDDVYYTPPMIDPAAYNLANNPHEIEKTWLREAYKRRDKEVADMEVDKTSMYAYIISKLSKESLDEIQGANGWATIEASRDPLALWKVIKSTHQILTTSKVASVIKKTAREEYAAYKQGIFEHIVDYKRRFDARLDALVVSGNTKPDDEDIAMDFMYGLDNNRYAEFKAEIVNDLQKGTLQKISDLNKMYILASRRVVIKTSKDTPGGATFATVDGQYKTPAKKPTGDKDGDAGKKTKEQKYAKRLAKMKCFNCGKKGHIAKACPGLQEDGSSEGEEEPPLAGMTLQGSCCEARESSKLHKWYKVCLDSGSQVNILDPRLLTNVITEEKSYRSMNGSATTSQTGYLDGFFKCQASADCPVNILSMSDVEDICPMTWVQGESITVHMDEQDLVFTKRDKMWVADFSDWVVQDEDRVSEVRESLCLLTVQEKEDMYMRREVCKALEAGEFLRALGYPTQKEALGVVRDGNIKNIPHTAEDVKRFFDIYGPQVSGLRGRTMKRRVRAAAEEDRGAKLQVTNQEMTADVMQAAGQKLLVSISKPLGLLLVQPVQSLSRDSLGKSLQAHLNTLRSRGFDARRVYVDPHKSLVSLQGQYPGVEIDLSGAGDHLNMIDTKIRRMKEIMRAVIDRVPFKLSKDRLKDLATYAVNRMNLKSTEGLISNESPRVRFTGIKPEFSAEFGLSFGDYVEAYNPRAEAKSNDVTVPRTEPCIALYPSANKNGSWVMYNINSNTYVRRSQWKKLPTSQVIINAMNALAGERVLTKADLIATGVPTDEEQLGDTPDMHTPDPDPTGIPTAEEESANDEELDDLPELAAPNGDDDSSSESEEDEDDKSIASDVDEDQEGLAELLQDAYSQASSAVQEEPTVPQRRTTRSNAGIKRLDQSYEWNLMNLSLGAAIRNFGDVAREACKDELVQLFEEKKALRPVKWESLTVTQRKAIIRSHMFLKEKYEDGRFIKMKCRVVADGRMQDKTVYSDYSSPTVKTRSVMTCLKLAAAKGWNLVKLDVGGAFLCAPIDDGQEVFMSLGPELVEKAVESMPHLAEFLTRDGKIIVKVDKAMYGLIQSAKLWYKELTRHLVSKGFRICSTDECVLTKRMDNGEYLVVLLYVDDILVLGKTDRARKWVKEILEQKYEKISVDEGDRLTYLGMTIVRANNGFEISMKSYIEDVLKLYGKEVNKCVTPAKQNLFDVSDGQAAIDAAPFHSIVAKLLYLGKRGRPDILLPVQFLCTRVKRPTVEDQRKLERVLGYIRLTRSWTRVFDNSPYDKVMVFIDASFATHDDGKGQSGCMVFLGNTLVHEACRKQRIVTKDSTESELVALSDYLEEGLLVDEFLRELGEQLEEQLVRVQPTIYQDNQSTIALIETGGGKQRTKYMKVRVAFVAERADGGDMMIQYLPTTVMVADLLTKPLQGGLFHRFAQTALGRLYARSNRGAKGNTSCAHTVQTLVVAMETLACSQPQNRRRKNPIERTTGTRG